MHWPVAFFPVAVDLSRRGWANEDIDDSNNGSNIDESVSIHETWSGMEDVVRLGLVRNIGVSNMPVLLLHEVLSRATIPPAVNQVELHPYLQQQNLLSYCHKRGVHVQGYSPLGTPGYKEAHEPSVLNDVVLQRLAAKHGVTVAQIALSWALQRGVSVVVKSISPQHLSENLLKTATTRATSETTMLHSILLCDDEMAEIATLDRGYRFFRPQDWWGDKAMAVFD